MSSPRLPQKTRPPPTVTCAVVQQCFDAYLAAYKCDPTGEQMRLPQFVAAVEAACGFPKWLLEHVMLADRIKRSYAVHTANLAQACMRRLCVPMMVATLPAAVFSTQNNLWWAQKRCHPNSAAYETLVNIACNYSLPLQSRVSIKCGTFKSLQKKSSAKSRIAEAVARETSMLSTKAPDFSEWTSLIDTQSKLQDILLQYAPQDHWADRPYHEMVHEASARILLCKIALYQEQQQRRGK